MSKALEINTEYTPLGSANFTLGESEEQREQRLATLLDRMEARAYTDAAKVKPMATHWIIDQFLPEGHSTLAGASFVGKTYVLANLVATILGIIKHEGVIATRKRKVMWITEDDNQIAQAVMVLDYLGGCSMRDFFEGCLIVPAERVPAEDLGEVVIRMIESRGWDQEPNPPLILVDTMAASLECDDINNPSKASRLLASLRVAWADYSVIITMHTSKSGDSKEAMGSTAFKADMQNSFYVIKLDDDHRELGHTKRRSAGQYSRIVTVYQGNIPVELPNREGQLETEWIPKINLVAQTSGEAKEWDEEHKESLADLKKKELESNQGVFTSWLRQGPKEALTKTELAKEYVKETGDLAPSVRTVIRMANELIKSGELTDSDGIWTYGQAE